MLSIGIPYPYPFDKNSNDEICMDVNGEERFDMMMLEDRFFQQEWVQELSNEDFRMLLYLLHFASKKTGIVELNMRQINFAANTGKIYTKDDVLSKFGNMLCMIPNKEHTAIFPDYIATNWAKNGKPIDTVRNPLFKSVVAELSNFGLTIEDVNALAKKKVVVSGNDTSCPVRVNTVAPKTESPKKKGCGVGDNDIATMFGGFWASYPSSCPRKTDKKKCLAKFATILRNSKDAVKMFNDIMNGLDKWKKCSTWNKDGGQFIRAPLVWLNNENWNDTPTGGSYGNTNKSTSANANYQSAASVGIF